MRKKTPETMIDTSENIINKVIDLYITQNKTREEVMAELGISVHDFKIIKKLGNIQKISPRQFKRDILSKYSIEEIAEYFSTHSREETSRHFNISEQNLKDLTKEYNLHHTTEQKISFRRKSCEKMYGVSCVLLRQDVRAMVQSEEAINKMMVTQRKNNLEKYGVEYTWERDDVKKKIKQTNLIRYGTEKGWASTEQGRTRISEIHSDPEYQKKEMATKRNNGSFNTSSNEEEIYELLSHYFSPDDIGRQYRSIQYPFNCDFYIKSIDLYIECNYHWTHGKMPFDADNQECINKLKFWKEKSYKSDFYKCAIDVWTRRDVEKIDYAKINKLNIIFMYPKNIHNIFIRAGRIVDLNLEGLGANGVMDSLRRQFLSLPESKKKKEDQTSEE